MRTFLGIIIKLIGTFVAAWIAYGLIDDNPLVWIFVVALVVTIVNYLIGDLLILTRSNNTVASIADGIMAALTAWIIDLATDDFNISWLSSLVFIVLIFIFEFFLHKYLVHDDED